MLPPSIPTTRLQTVLRILLGAFMLKAGSGHLTFQRAEFQAQVPTWLPLDSDLVVLLSGLAEISLGLAMILWSSRKVYVGLALATFFVLIFPGNISQYVNHISAFNLDTDRARLIRLFFQPVLIAWALWSTGAWQAWRQRHRRATAETGWPGTPAADVTH
ncbi:DoxX family protein [Hymenobacter profundi]|uniref:DoxX family membrane protein n=1 Tax=Hymenobacter profundi TaxID=1982110 RepID=A0ABS6X0R0_9BACT|nr:hypothetical protein [Hymenobacter profundi]MBW3129420.1 hypothetical protein [Hymenobacter profundi]